MSCYESGLKTYKTPTNFAEVTAHDPAVVSQVRIGLDDLHEFGVGAECVVPVDANEGALARQNKRDHDNVAVQQRQPIACPRTQRPFIYPILNERRIREQTLRTKAGNVDLDF